MANYATLKAAIQQVVKTNGNNEITGSLLQQSLLAMINSLGDGFLFKGIATPATNPGTPDQNIFYFSDTQGTYVNFNNLVVGANEVAILKYNGTWTKDVLGVVTSETIDSVMDIVVGITNALQVNGIPFNNVSWESGKLIRASDGVLVSVSDQQQFNVSDYIPVQSGEYFFVGTKASNSFLDIAGYSSPGVFVSSFVSGRAIGNTSILKINIPAGINYVRVSYNDTLVPYAGIWKFTGSLYEIVESLSNYALKSELRVAEYNSELRDFENTLNIIGQNIINPAKIITGKYINIYGNFATGASGYAGSVYDEYIPVVAGQSITTFKFASTSSSILTFAAYDINKNFLRGITGNNVYVQQGNEAYIRIGFPVVSTDYPTQYANLGSVLLPYEPYKLLKNTFESIYEQIANKVTKINGINLVDPNKIVPSSYLNRSTGAISTAAADSFFVSGLIPVNGQNICSNARNTSPVSAWTVYGSDGVTIIRTSANSGDSQNYTYVSGDVFIRFSFDTARFNTSYPGAFACYGNTLLDYEAFTEYAPVEELRKELQTQIDAIKENVPSGEPTTAVSPDYVYSICDDVENNSLELYADHFVNVGIDRKRVLFKNSGTDRKTIVAPISSDGTLNGGVNKKEETISDEIIGDYSAGPLSITHRSVLNTFTANTGIRVLCIGDSVTAGTGANYPFSKTGGPRFQYWRFMNMFCARDKKNHNGNGFDFVSIGKQVSNQYRYDDVLYKTFAEGRGGWGVSNYLYDETYNTLTNLFYDANKVWSGNYASELNSAGVKFSLASYLAKYKTLADDGKTRLVVGSTAGTEITDINECDVCTPNVIVITLTHNQNAAAYEQNMPLLIKAIKNEFPDIPIILNAIDCTGSYNSDLYPEFDASSLKFTALHGQIISVVPIIKNLVSSFTNVWYCPCNFIQPTAWSTTYREPDLPENYFNMGFKVYVKTGVGPDYHPSAFAHASWAYELLACIKWILN